MRSYRTAALLAVLVGACASKDPAPGVVIYPPATGGSPANATVHGAVVTASGLPMPGLRVAVAGRPAVTTDDQGRFEFADVPRPYTVLVGWPEWQRAVAYVGLTRVDPALTFPLDPGGANRVGSVCGWVTGVDAAAPAPWIVLETASGTTGSGAMYPGDGSYCAGTPWNGPESIEGTVHVLAATTANDASSWWSTGFPGAGSATVTLADQQATRDVNFAVSPVTASSVQIRSTLPAGWTAVLSVDGFFGASHGPSLPLATVSSAQPWPAVAIPAIDRFRTHVWVWGSGPEGGTQVHRVLDGAPPATLDLAVPLPPSPLAPADAATDVAPGARFSWTPLSGGDLTWLILSCGTTSYSVLTGDGSAALPDFAAVGVPCPAGSSGVWTLFGMSGTGGVDGVAATGTLEIDGRTVSHDAAIGAMAGSRNLTWR